METKPPDQGLVRSIFPSELALRMQEFDALIDVRSPSEWRLDHLPGAINLPVLDDEQRILIGTQYKESSFEAKRAGAALISRNIARHLDVALADKPRSWKPLIYCWRGGSRSHAMAIVLDRVGWKACVLKGGYAEFRRFVVQDLDRLTDSFRYRVICGVTGSGKSLLLRSLAKQGRQVLDLEALAHHRGSLLGSEPQGEQPSQKAFEMRIWDCMRRLDPAQPIYCESESKKIGQVQVPNALMSKMRSADCIELIPDINERVDFLCGHYQHFFDTPLTLSTQLDRLSPLVGRERLGTWKALIQARAWPELVRALLVEHYDPTYRRSMGKNYALFDAAHKIRKHATMLTNDELSGL